MRNRFDRMEWAGAFGDLGTLVPFVVAYISLLGMNPAGLLLAFGLAKVATGLYYRTPFPVQPMKAIGVAATTQATRSFALTPDAVYGAGLVTGAFWFALGVTGLTQRIASLVPRTVALGIVLGLGFSFMLEGVQMIAAGWVLGLAALAGTLLLLGNRRVPAMFLLLVFGAGVALVRHHGLLHDLAAIRPAFHWPTWQLGGITWHDLGVGALFLALPQLPLTLGNAVIAITRENNQLFPDRAVTERRVSISTGVMNLVAPLLGGVPMCHGAGGMAGHVRFGARTGGALVILGAILVVIALFFSGSVTTILKIFPQPVLGVMLFLAGMELALRSGLLGEDERKARLVALAVAAITIWNVGIAFLFGIGIHHLLRRRAIPSG